MNGQRPPTPNQPQVNDQRIYSSKKMPTVRVKLKGGDKELVINQRDFDPDRYVRLD